MKKIVAKLDIFDEKDKKKALQTVSNLSGIDSVSIDMKDRKLTVIGDVDPIDVVNKLRKLWHAELLSIGPHKEPERKTEDDKKKEVIKDDKKKEVVKEVYEKMKEVIKKKEEKKKDAKHNNNQDEYIHEVIKTYQNLLEMYSKILDLYSEY